MRKRSFGILVTSSCLVLCLLATSFAQQPRNRNTTPAKPVNNLKLRYKTTMAGQTSESTTLIRGSRERSEMKLGPGMEIISITQCDLKRTVQISDTARKYVVTPMDAGETTSAGASSSMPAASPVTRGGVVTYTTTSTDTGERRDMFGFKARHVKTVTTITSTPDACSPMNQKIERDGWYIDFSYGMNCELNRSQTMGSSYAAGGCRDRYQFKQIGAGRDGYALIETTTMYGPDGQAMFTSNREVVELSREPLDAALFDVPAGYTETANAQELYMPAMGVNMDQPESRPQIGGRQSAPSTPSASEPARIRVGVVQINNRSGREISTDDLRQRLIGNIEDGAIEAVPLNALTAADAEAEAKAKGCSFILFTDLATLKASKIGGMFGRVTGVSGAGKTESKVEFKLIKLSDKSTQVQSSASAKEEVDAACVGTALDQEGTVVKAAVLRGAN